MVTFINIMATPTPVPSRAAARTLRPSGTTSLPMPSPGPGASPIINVLPFRTNVGTPSPQNLTDAVLSTLFWAGIGLVLLGYPGAAALALAHRACNMLDTI